MVGFGKSVTPTAPTAPAAPTAITSVDRKGRKDRRMLLILVDGIVGGIVDYRQLSVVDDDVLLYVLLGGESKCNTRGPGSYCVHAETLPRPGLALAA